MGITLNPREYFTIVRQISDHTDTNNYYVQAVVRNSRTNEIIDTVNLTDQGNQRHTSDYQVPADVSGLGFFVDITTSVYTDSDHTTKSPLYGDENETYLVFNRTARIGGSGGGADIDYKKIQKMIDEGIKTIVIPKPKQLKMPEMPQLEPVMEAIADVVLEIRNIKIPQPEKLDLGPVIERLESVKKELKDVIGAIPKTDLSPISKKLESVPFESIGKEAVKIGEAIKELKAFLSDDTLKQFTVQLEDIGKTMEGIRKVIKEQTSNMPDNSRISRVKKLLG